MSPWLNPWVVAPAAAAALALGAGLYWWRRSRRADADEVERKRRQHINKIGRMCEGHLTEVIDASELESGKGPLLVYTYEVRGVEYRAAQDIGFYQEKLDFQHVAAGKTARVKYDSKNPTNSIVLSENWSGI